MNTFERLRQVLQHLKEEAQRAKARQSGAGVIIRRQDGQDAYHFDVREQDVSTGEEQASARAPIEHTPAARSPSYGARHGGGRRQRLIARMREPGGLKDVVLLNEIISRPLALRGKGPGAGRTGGVRR